VNGAARLQSDAAPGWRWPIALAILAVGAIAGALIEGVGFEGAIWLHYLCKPAATGLIIAYAVRVRDAAEPRYRRWILAGLAFSLVGDICLMLPVDAFVAGLAAFLFAHLCYIAALWRGARGPALFVCLLAMAAYAALNIVGLWPHLPATLRGAVIAYTCVLAAMAALALARAVSLRARAGQPAWRAALGALLFVASDSILAWDRFAGHWPWAIAWVLATYYAAQWCIAGSIARSIAASMDRSVPAVSARETGAG